MRIKKQLQAAYLDYLNDYLTTEIYAEHNNLTCEQALKIIELGRAIHDELTNPIFNKE